MQPVFLWLWIVLLLAMVCGPFPAPVATPPLTIICLAGGIEPCRGGPVTYASSVTWFGVDCVALLKGNGGVESDDAGLSDGEHHVVPAGGESVNVGLNLFQVVTLFQAHGGEEATP